MKYQDQRSTFGKDMFNKSVNGAKHLMSSMWLYYVLNYTWGLIMTLIGWIVYIFIKVFIKDKIIEEGKIGPAKYIMIGRNWGGLTLGTSIFISEGSKGSYLQHLKEHELGHTFHNALFGVLAIFLVFIPSFIRYWYQSIRTSQGKSNVPYDSIWFEGSATTIGGIYFGEIK